MSLKKDLIELVILAVGGPILIISTSSGFGSREDWHKEWGFNYQGKPAVVMHKDIRFGPDGNYILIDKRDKVEIGELTSDDGKAISISKYFWTKKVYIEGYTPRKGSSVIG